MIFKSLRMRFTVVWIVVFAGISSCSPSPQTQLIEPGNPVNANPLGFVTGEIYNQPVDPNGKILLSAWLDPDGSDYDQYIWDNFTLQTNETITDINWYGVYDPLMAGKGGPVVDFQVQIFPSNIAGTEPAVAGAPLLDFFAGGNANETPVGIIGSATLYSYSVTLPSSFAVTAGVKYWIQIEAYQHGIAPDWCFAAGAGGDASHFLRGAGAGGDVMYRSAPGDAAFTLLGPVPEVPTPTDSPTDTPTTIPTDTPTDVVPPTDTPTDTPIPTDTPTDTPLPTSTDTPTNTPANTSTSTPMDTPTMTPVDTATSTPTNTPVNTSTSTPMDTPTMTPVDTATSTPTNTPANTSTSTPTMTPVNTATSTPTNTPTTIPVDTPTHTPTSTPTSTPVYVPTNTPTPTPISNTPGRVTGGGFIRLDQAGNKSTFGFIVRYEEGDMAPRGNLTYHDHRIDLLLKVISFDMLVIEGNNAWFTGTGTLGDGQWVEFMVRIHDTDSSSQADTFYISIPAANGYTASGSLSGGNLTIH